MFKRDMSTDEEIERLQRWAKIRLYSVFVLTGIFFLLFLVFAIWIEYDNKQEELLGRIVLSFVIPVSLTIPAFFGFYYLIANRAYNRFSNTFKNRYVLKTLCSSNLFEDLTYNQKQGFTYEEIYDAAVVDCGMKHYYLSEDMVTGSYKGIPFMFSDVNTRRLVKYGKTMRVESIFNGQVLRFSSFDGIKTSQGYLQIFQKEFLSNIKGRVGKFKIETENAAFNRKYDVYATDELNAYYILTPSLMEKIEEFSTQVESQIAIAFHGPVIFVSVNRKLSMFDPSVDKPLEELKQNIFKDIRVVKAAGDILLSDYSHYL